ncbi:unnamed protein product (macronuclear) [Paramecium tetraurelia]|uniref:Superoxide dismutase n=1 Tax=Paramecium tetraurelia TaxID=5888 RepID=A0BGP5_PARTE|nr:uncharacterized protein GSPATT00028747001 [Paramecium tetraurelia]CAK57712.1 unnamed protein product [Paramecium tetraurelia]|eukprot:XP_001425110.1 hypothetical protein (macronuclear) [Paramecium tetraurelia strain d4-2]
MQIFKNSKFFFGTLKAHTLPALKYGYSDLEPVLSATLLEFHHSKHHQAYINNLNAAQEQLEDALTKNDVQKIATLQGTIKFNLGGHLNHSVVLGELDPNQEWRRTITSWKQCSSLRNQQKLGKTAAIQGSGWGFLGVDQQSKKLRYLELPNQEIPQNYGLTPILTIDVWEHAYWWDYKNVRPNFLANVWKIVNWKDVEARYNQAQK